MSFQGLSFPIRPGDKGLFAVKSDIELIEGNIIQILATTPGQRVMLPEFGSRIFHFIHEPLDHITCALVRFETIRAIQRWEKRIILDKKNTTIQAFPAQARIKIILQYSLKLGNNINNNLALEISKKGGVTKWLD